MSRAEEPPHRRWMGPALAVAFVCAAFAVGAGFIFIGSLEVSNRFDVFGYPRVVPGHTHVFRAWAFTDDPPGPIVGADLELALVDADGRATARIDGAGGADLALEIPADVQDPVQVRATLSLDGTVLEEGTFALELVKSPTQAVSVQDAGDEEEIRIHLFPPRGVVVPHIENPVFVRVIRGVEQQPVVGARVAFELDHGHLLGDVPAPVVTNDFGLARVDIGPLDETDWTLTATLPDGTVHTQRRTLYPQPLNVRAQPTRRLVGPGHKLQLRVDTVSSPEGVYTDIIADDAWLASAAHRYGGEGSMFGWTPKLKAPPSTRVVDLVVCFSDVDCGQTYAIEPVVWSGKRLDDAEIAQVLGDSLQTLGVDTVFVSRGLAALGAGAGDKDAHRLLGDYFAARQPTTYDGPGALLRTEPATEARLSGVKDAARGWLNTLAVLLVVCLGLLIAVFALRTSAPRARAMRAVVDESEELIDTSAVDGQRQKIMFIVEMGALLLTIGVFAAGIILLLQQL